MIRAGHIIGVVALLLSAAFARDSVDVWIDQTELPSLAIETSVEIKDRNGELLRAYPVEDGKWRLRATLATTDPRFIDMLVRYEDKRFFRHSGVDFIAMIRAATQAVLHAEVVSGGSTLTMQVARLLENSGTGTWRGKLRQVRLALALERNLSKSQILDLYLQRAPYGGNLEGVSAATRAYFGKPARRLTVSEAALLVALPQSPETRRPDRHPKAAKAARLRVLNRLMDAGIIRQEAVGPAASAPIPVARKALPMLAPHLADRVLGRAEAEITTTLDASLQSRLQRLSRTVLHSMPAQVSTAIVVVDHRNGEILASVGSASYSNTRNAGFVDMTQTKRSPGSTLKPLIYGLAFDRGLAHPETLISDRPRQFGVYAPQNFDGAFRGDVSIREALQMSLNLPVISLLDAIGPAVLVERMKTAGMSPEIPGGKPGLAVALGGVGVSLQDLVGLYAGIASGGQINAISAHPAGEKAEARIVSKRSAWYVTDILRDTPAPANTRAGQIAFKTGTSYGHRDAWAIGYDGAHVIGIWIGRPDGTPVPGAFGGDLAAPVLFEAFGYLGDRTPLPPAPADALILGHSELPAPLRRFREKRQDFAGSQPVMAFPPDGARVEVDSGPLVARIREGHAPFTWLANGVPIATRSHDRQQEIEISGRGFVTITVIDSKGRSTRAQVFVN